ncbi:MAG: hypothetical protein JXP34_12985 [Planctomycetes bacterium]|nr:hypothetical protein [Planctomycetota bacterium]
MARRATLIASLRANRREVLLLDGGDCFLSTTRPPGGASAERQLLAKSRSIVASYNIMGYAALAVADTDLALGLDDLRALAKEAHFPFLLANLVDVASGESVFGRSHVVEIAGVRVGIFAVLMDSLRKEYLARVAPGTVLRDPVEVAREVAADLQKQSDIIIALSHVDQSDTSRILAEIPSVRFAIDPHCTRGIHMIWIPEEEFFRWQDGRMILATDGQGARLGCADVRFVARDLAWRDAPESPDGTAANEVRTEILAVEPHYLEAPGVKAIVEAFRRSTRAPAIDREALLREAKEKYLTADACKECHEEVYAAWRKTAHGRAYATLVKSGDEHRHDCVPCHTLGYGETFLDTHGVGSYKDVQCESCHGTSPSHREDPAVNRFPKITADACLPCHNPEKLGTPFNVAERMAAARCPGGS